MWILLTAYNDRRNGISQANNQEIKQLSDHTSQERLNKAP